MSLALELVLNLLMAGLLAVTIAYCYVLNRRIQVLQDSKSELAELLGHFDESTRRASDSIMALQAASKKIGETVQSRIDKANFAIDDLNAMIAKAEHVTDKVEASVAIARQKEKLGQVPSSHIQQVREAVQTHRPAPEPVRLEPAVAAATPPGGIAALQALIGRVAARTTSSDPALRGNQKITPGMAARPQSEAEHDLLQMLRTTSMKV